MKGVHIPDQSGYAGMEYGLTDSAQACEDALKGSVWLWLDISILTSLLSPAEDPEGDTYQAFVWTNANFESGNTNRCYFKGGRANPDSLKENLVSGYHPCP